MTYTEKQKKTNQRQDPVQLATKIGLLVVFLLGAALVFMGYRAQVEFRESGFSSETAYQAINALSQDVSLAWSQKMQPELQRVQKLYANDKQRMQIEMMRVYQTHKTSPMSGCLPMLIQIPIFFALYKALLISVQMRNANFLWIHDLATMDPYFILPILMGATMWLQQYLQQNKTDTKNKNDITAQTAQVMKWMPILFAIMFAWMPSGLVLYWTVSNIFGIGQMMWLKHKSK